MFSKRPIVSACARACAVVLCLVSWAGLTGRASAQGSSKRIAALDLIPIGLADVEARQTTELLRRAVGRNPRYRLAPAPLRLRPMLLALGCARLDAACLIKIGKQLDVDLILFGELVRQSGKDRLSAQLFDVSTGRVLRSETRELVDAPGSTGYLAALEDTTQLALGEALALSIEANVEGAIILVNGQPVGTTPFTVTEGLRAGGNDVMVRRPGFDDFKVRVIVRPGRPHAIRAELKKTAGGPVIATAPKTGAPGSAGPPGQSAKAVEPGAAGALVDGGAKKGDAVASEPFYKKWWFWTVIGVVVVGGASAGIAAGASGGGAKPPTVGVEF